MRALMINREIFLYGLKHSDRRSDEVVISKWILQFYYRADMKTLLMQYEHTHKFSFCHAEYLT